MTINGNATGTINLKNLNITGNLTINTPNKHVTVEASTTVGGTTNVQDVSNSSFESSGTHTGGIVVTDPDNSRIDLSGTASAADVTINTEGNVILAGTYNGAVIVSKAATVQVESGAQVGTLTVEASAAGTTIANAGTIAEVVANADVEITGTQPVKVTPSGDADVVTSVGTQAELEIALNDAKVKKVKFTKDIETSSQVLVKQANQSINGGGFKLIAKKNTAGTFTYSDPNKSILTILSANGVKISNLTVDASDVNTANKWDGVYALQVYNSTGVKLDKLILQNGDAGLLVNASTVTVNDITTKGNEFGGIEVSKGTEAGLLDSELTINGTSTHQDATGKPAVWVYPTQGSLVSDLYVATANEQGNANNQTYYNLKTELSVFDFVIGEYDTVVAGTLVNVPVTLKATKVNNLGYEAVIAEVSTTKQPNGSSVKFYAVDSNNTPIEQIDNGIWGPNAGFALAKSYDATTPFTVIFSEAGDYSIVVKLKDKVTGEYIAEKTVEVTVNAPTV